MPKRFSSLQSRPPLVYTTPQAQKCSDFTVPPLDGSLLNGELIDWHMERNGSYTYAVLLDEGGGESIPLTYAELGEAIHKLGRHLLDTIPGGPICTDGRPKTIALYAALDPLIYVVTILGIIRAGFVPFLLSPRNSRAALVHLLSTTSCTYIIASTPSFGVEPTAMESITQSILDEMDTSGKPLHLLNPFSVRDLFPRLVSTPVVSFTASEHQPIPPLSTLVPDALENPQWPWIIIHSSGSTKFPKPVHIGQRSGLQHWLTWPWNCETDIGGKVQGTLGTPCFHGMGLAMHVGATFSAGAISALWKPKDPPVTATPEKFLDGLRKSKANYSVIVPSFLKLWSTDPTAIEVLADLDVVCYGAGPLPKSVGDQLVAGGVNIQNCYGLTETGLPVTILTKQKPGYDWQYVRFSKQVKPRLIPEEKGRYILHLIDCDAHTLPFINIEEDGVRAFNTQDVLEEHPVKPGYYRVVGRADDQIMMSNGEKTNPGPLELMIQTDPLVNGAFMFGRSRTHTGIAVEPLEPIDLSDRTEVARFRNAIWPSVEKANKFAPQHSRIFKEYILICDPVNRPLPRTPKGDVQRKPAYELYAEDIERLYREVEEAIETDWAKAPHSWDEEGIHAFVDRIIDGTVGVARKSRVDPGKDLFMQGCDSLQATYIRQAILAALHSYASTPESRLPPDYASKIPNNFVYEHLTQNAIEEFLLSLVRDESIEDSRGEQRKIKEMKAMVDKYTKDWPFSAIPLRVGYRPRKEVVLITGTTGTLGTYLLGELLKDSRFVTVYALNRGAGCAQRQRDAFLDKGLDVSLLDNKKLHLLEYDMADPKLGLSHSSYEQIRQSVTTIIANAWTLNFSMTLSSFDSHIRGIRNLINLALCAPYYNPQILFSSSVATILGWESDSYVPERDLGPQYAINNGYSESKWVAEQVLVSATRFTGLRTRVLRIGQLSGSRVNGSWNITDWVPQIVQSGCALRMLPDFPSKSVVSWLPIDVAAEAFINAIFLTVPGSRYVNVVHPYPVSWHTLFAEIARALGNLPLVPYIQWYSALQEIALKPHAAEKVTAVRILDFFSAGTIDLTTNVKREAMGMGMLATDLAKRFCPSVASAPPLNSEDASKWIQYWRDHGMFEL